MVLLLLRIAAAPALIALGSAAQRRFGQAIGGRLVGLPLTSLPLLALLTVSQGTSFAGSTAAALLGAGIAQSAWCLSYVLIGRRRSPLVATVGASASFAAACVVLYLGDLRPLVAAILSVVSIFVTLAVWPGARGSSARSDDRGGRSGASTGGSLVARMVAGAAFTLGLTGAASAVGPELAGLIGAFPVLTVVLAVATHRRDGSERVAAFLEGVMAGSLSVVAGLSVVAFFLVSLGPLAAFPLAVLVSGATQLVPVNWVQALRGRVGSIDRDRPVTERIRAMTMGTLRRSW